MTMESLRERVAIVTGGTRGIGRAIAFRLVAEGARVAICGTRQKSVDEAAAALRSIASSSSEHVFATVADISKPGEAERFITDVQRNFGAIHVLVNNAGTGIFRSV